MVESHLGRGEECSCCAWGRRGGDKFSIVRVLGPGAKVLEEPAWVVWAGSDFGAPAGFGEVGVYATGEKGQILRREQVLDADRSVSLEGRDDFRRYGRGYAVLYWCRCCGSHSG